MILAIRSGRPVPAPPAAGSPRAAALPAALPRLSSLRPSRTRCPRHPRAPGGPMPGRARLPGPGAYFLFRSASGRAWGCALSRQRAGPHCSPPAPAVRTMATASRSRPRALPSQCRRHPYESGPGLHPLQPAGGDPPQRGRESAAPTARATVRLQRSVERCAERIRVGRPRRPLLYHGPAKGAPGTPAPGPCLIARPFGLRLRGRILPGPASRLPETNS